MSRYYASIQGSRGEATRQGTAGSGMRGHIRGWHVGGRVECHSQPDGKLDWINVMVTGGSQGYWQHEVARVRELDDGAEITVFVKNEPHVYRVDSAGKLVDGAMHMQGETA